MATETAYEGTRYNLMRRNTKTLADIFTLSSREVTEVLAPALDLERDYFAGYARNTLPAILDKWGNVSATAAVQHYEAAREAWRKANARPVEVKYVDEPYTILQPGSNTRAERNYAAKVTQGRIFQAQIAAGQYDIDPVIDQAMVSFVKSGPLAGRDAAANAMTRQIGAQYRNTMLFNAGLDESVTGVQRVAHPGACAWCKTLAVGGVGRRQRIVLDYAMHYHDHCKCSIEPLFIGDKPLRPDYYDAIEEDIRRAYAGEYDPKFIRTLRPGASTKAQMRELVQLVRAVDATKRAEAIAQTVAAEAVSAAPAYKFSDWFFSKKFTGDRNENELLARKTPMAEAFELPRLPEPDSLEQALKSTNPKYDKHVEAYSSNCARVINAYELRRRGFDVTANAYRRGLSQSAGNYIATFKDEEGYTAIARLKSIKKGLRHDKKEAYVAGEILAEHPEGARGIIRFEWVNYGGAGHVINWEIVDGKVVWVDAQVGKSGDELADYFTTGKNHQWARLDDLEPMAYIGQYIEEVEG